MRPRPDAAENAIRPHRRILDLTIASMRPRPDAAENLRASLPRATLPAGFNEAAARCRGKQEQSEPEQQQEQSASMRPRPDAAENLKIKGRIRPLISALQ